MATEKAKRGRKRKFDLDHALGEAQRRFHLDGYEGVRMSDICHALGITQTSLYAAFGSKIELYARVVERYAQTDARFVSKALEAAQSPGEVWRNVLTAAAESYGRLDAPGCLVLGTDVATGDAQAQAVLERQVSRTAQAIVGRLTDLRAEDAEADARAILTVLRGLSAAARAGDGKASLMETVERLMPKGA